EKVLQEKKRESAHLNGNHRNDILLSLVTDKDVAIDYQDWLGKNSIRTEGCFFGVVAVRLDLTQGGFSKQGITLHDRKLMKYASLNVLEECLSQWQGVSFNGFGSELIGIIQVTE